MFWRLAIVLPLVWQNDAIRVTTRLVEVSVVVEDKAGKPVVDLTQSEFEILEDGVPQDLRLFLKQGSEAASDAGPELPSGVYSNRRGPGAVHGSRSTVVLFDALNTPWEHRQFAGRHLAPFMKNIPPEESVVVLLLSSTGLQVLHNDKRALLPNFRHDEMLGEAETSGEQMQADRVKHHRILLSLRAMEVIAEHMAGVAGRKNLIWITAGIPRQINLYESPRSIRDRASYTAEYKQAISALNGASIAVYTVDARGLDAMGGSRPVYGPQNRWERPANMDAINSDQQNREGLKDLAYATGGRVYFDRNDLDRSMAEALADARTSYTLGYYQPRDADGTWRRIQVRVKRKDVKVRHRLGYLAIDRTGGARDASLKRVLASPLDSTAIGMTGALQVETHGAWRALLQIDPSHVSLTPAGSGYRCRLEIVTLVRNSAGQAVGKAEIDTVDRLLEGQALRSAMENGVLFRKDLRVPQNAHDVRFAVRDPVTGLLGTLSIPLAKK